MSIEQFKQKLQHYLQGRLSENEQDEIDRWYDSISEDKVNPFQNQIHKQQIQQEILTVVQAHIYTEKTPVPILKQRWLVAAASVLLVCAISFFFMYSSDKGLFGLFSNHGKARYTELTTEIGDVRQFILPDSSSIWLSGNTRLRYDKDNYSSNRKVYLDRGEVFFNVHRDTLHPFVIESGDLDIKVLGTSFNVNHAGDSHRIAVDVKSGKVSVTQRKNNIAQVLVKGESLRYDPLVDGFTLLSNNPHHTDLWTSGGIFLHQATFSDLQDLVYNRYGIHLHSEKNDTDSSQYAILMPQVKSVDHLLDMICSIHQIKYRREKNEIILY
ncbi:FecR family protein [Sphingobacterium spiritivorum]|uniref:FecR family protein n=1 Tax=Sphingobacterium spiritivorum TaxID=258 RepID=UPI00191B386B|nr:FecR family protein [Sphingobacterium spiritivorum]QQT25337.1 FecR domain-containing protein [Sphingobacterium spiritivorum]